MYNFYALVYTLVYTFTLFTLLPPLTLFSLFILFKLQVTCMPVCIVMRVERYWNMALRASEQFFDGWVNGWIPLRLS